jgi:hypothetical protein
MEESKKMEIGKRKVKKIKSERNGQRENERKGLYSSTIGLPPFT